MHSCGKCTATVSVLRVRVSRPSDYRLCFDQLSIGPNRPREIGLADIRHRTVAVHRSGVQQLSSTSAYRRKRQKRARQSKSACGVCVLL